jgi:DNA-binding SARP family transcriptional activator
MALRIHLFGQFRIERDGRAVRERIDSKSHWLLAYLLLNRGRPFSRDALATLLWAGSGSEQSKKYLRQALWQLHSAMDSRISSGLQRLLQIDLEWVGVDPAAEIWLDVNFLERAFALNQSTKAAALTEADIAAMTEAVNLYQGDLLEDCDQEWCVYARERLRAMYLSVLDQLMQCAELHQDYGAGIGFGLRVLAHDRAQERAHRRLMRLHYLAGDRTAAIRQYEWCVRALKEELDVAPSPSTLALHEQIKAGVQPIPEAAVGTLQGIRNRLRQMHEELGRLQTQIQNELQLVDVVLAQD